MSHVYFARIICTVVIFKLQTIQLFFKVGRLSLERGPVEGAVLTGFLSSTSLILRFSSGMIPLGSLSCGKNGEHNQKEDTKQLLTGVTNLSVTHCGVLKVVQTVVCEDEPSPLPGFHSSPCEANMSLSEKFGKMKGGEMRTEASDQAADRQTDVRADRQMTAPEDFCYQEQNHFHPDPPLHHAHTITTAAKTLIRYFIV